MSEVLNTEEYKKGITLLMEARSGKPVSNRMPQHAAVLYEVFFEHAREEVVAFSENLDSRVFQESNVRNALVKALVRGVRVRILVQEAPETNSLSEICESMALSIDKASDDDANVAYNFCVKDRESYRFEKDRNTTEAFAKMYQPEEAKRLYDHFEGLWKNRRIVKYGQ